jgi:hypothetical protein
MISVIRGANIRIIVAIGVLLTSTLMVIIAGPENSRIRAVQNYPATLCPANLSDASSTSVLPSSKTLVRQIPNKKGNISPAKSSHYLSAKPVLVEGASSTSINVTRTKSRTLATVACSISKGNQWFVGGSGAVTSRASLQIINSGLGASIVDLVVYTSTAMPSVVTKRIFQNSSKRIYLDTLAPGENSIVIHAITRSGRATIFMHDQRQRGLKSLGSEFVSQSADPANLVVIPAVSNVALSNGTARQKLRILVPGKVEAKVQAKLVSTDGSFIPVGLDNLNVAASQVLDISFKPILRSRNFVLLLTSDRPIVAAVMSSGANNGTNDFSWSTSVKEIGDLTLYLGGLRPDVVFQGKNVGVDVEWVDTRRKIHNKFIQGKGLAVWRPRSGVVRVTFSAQDKGIYGGAIFKEQYGFSFLPLMPGSQLESAAIPSADARVITRE